MNLNDYAYQNFNTLAAISLPLTDGLTEAIKCPFSGDLWVQVTVAGLASGESVTGRVQGSLDGVGYDNIAADDLDTTISTDGTTLLNYSGKVPPYILVSGFVIPSGSVATVAVKAYYGTMS